MKKSHILLGVGALFSVLILGSFVAAQLLGSAATGEDVDGDGVVDTMDGCLETAAGDSVDEFGCSNDDLGFIDEVDSSFTLNDVSISANRDIHANVISADPSFVNFEVGADSPDPASPAQITVSGLTPSIPYYLYENGLVGDPVVLTSSGSGSVTFEVTPSENPLVFLADSHSTITLDCVAGNEPTGWGFDSATKTYTPPATVNDVVRVECPATLDGTVNNTVYSGASFAVGIYVQNQSDVTIKGGTVAGYVNNIYTSNAHNLLVDGVTVNTTPVTATSAHALYIYGATNATVTNFTVNRSYNGYGVYVHNGNATVSDSTFIVNDSSIQGTEGIHSTGGVVYSTNNSFSGLRNPLYAYGGGQIFSTSDDMIAASPSLYGTAGLYAYNNSAYISAQDLTIDHQYSYGARAYFGDIDIDGCTMNNASRGTYAAYGTLNVSNCSITNAGYSGINYNSGGSGIVDSVTVEDAAYYGFYGYNADVEIKGTLAVPSSFLRSGSVGMSFVSGNYILGPNVEAFDTVGAYDISVDSNATVTKVSPVYCDAANGFACDTTGPGDDPDGDGLVGDADLDPNSPSYDFPEGSIDPDETTAEYEVKEEDGKITIEQKGDGEVTAVTSAQTSSTIIKVTEADQKVSVETDTNEKSATIEVVEDSGGEVAVKSAVSADEKKAIEADLKTYEAIKVSEVSPTEKIVKAVKKANTSDVIIAKATYSEATKSAEILLSEEEEAVKVFTTNAAADEVKIVKEVGSVDTEASFLKLDTKTNTSVSKAELSVDTVNKELAVKNVSPTDIKAVSLTKLEATKEISVIYPNPTHDVFEVKNISDVVMETTKALLEPGAELVVSKKADELVKSVPTSSTEAVLTMDVLVKAGASLEEGEYPEPEVVAKPLLKDAVVKVAVMDATDKLVVSEIVETSPETLKSKTINDGTKDVVVSELALKADQVVKATYDVVDKKAIVENTAQNTESIIIVDVKLKADAVVEQTNDKSATTDVGKVTTESLSTSLTEKVITDATVVKVDEKKAVTLDAVTNEKVTEATKTSDAQLKSVAVLDSADKVSMEKTSSDSIKTTNENDSKDILVASSTLKQDQKDKVKVDPGTNGLLHKNDSATDKKVRAVELKPKHVKEVKIDVATKEVEMVDITKDTYTTENNLVTEAVLKASTGIITKLGSVFRKAVETNTSSITDSMVQKESVKEVDLAAGECYTYLQSYDAQKTIDAQACEENTTTLSVKEEGEIIREIDPGTTEYGIGGEYLMDNHFDLHIIDRTKTTYCAGKGSCKTTPSGVEIRVFDRDDVDFQAAWTGNPDGVYFDEIYDAGVGIVGRCVTNASGECRAGWGENLQNTLIIGKYVDSGKSVYFGAPAGPGSMEGNVPNANHQVIMVVEDKGLITYKSAAKTIITGSELEIIHPDFVIWENDEELYPFLFTSAENWTVDVCIYVPEGYEVVDPAECTQVLVAGESQAILFRIVETSSPEPNFTMSITGEHDGNATTVEETISGLRMATKLAQAEERDVEAVDVDEALAEDEATEEVEEDATVTTTVANTETEELGFWARIKAWFCNVFGIWCS